MRTTTAIALLLAAGAAPSPLDAQRLEWEGALSGVGMRVLSTTGPVTQKLSGAVFGFQGHVLFARLITLNLGYWQGQVTPADGQSSIAPRDTSIRLGADRFRARLFASSFHQVIVALEREDGFIIKTLYAGAISDTLQVFWTGEDTLYLANDSGRLVFSVTSLTTAGRQGRVVRVPLDLVLGPQDTLPSPPPLPDSLFLPEKETAGKGLGALVRGAGVGVAVALLPGLVAGGDAPSGSRYVVAGGLSLAGLVGFLKHRPGRPLPDNIAANQSLREGWQAQVQTTAQENVIRAQQKRLDIHVGPPEVIGGGP